MLAFLLPLYVFSSFVCTSCQRESSLGGTVSPPVTSLFFSFPFFLCRNYQRLRRESRAKEKKNYGEGERVRKKRNSEASKWKRSSPKGGRKEKERKKKEEVPPQTSDYAARLAGKLTNDEDERREKNVLRRAGLTQITSPDFKFQAFSPQHFPQFKNRISFSE